MKLMLKKIFPITAIIFSILLIGWGSITTFILLSSIKTGNYPTASDLLGLYVSIAILGIIPITIGLMILLWKRLVQEKVEAVSGIEEKSER
jgi:nitrate reductase gamma subunit